MAPWWRPSPCWPACAGSRPWLSPWQVTTRRVQRVLVTGATGTVGRFLVQALSKMGATVRAASRATPRPEQVMANPALEWTELDFSRPESFAAALAEVDRLFLIPAPGDPEPQHVASAFLEAAQRSGVQRVVALSSMGVDLRPGSGLYRFENVVHALPPPMTHTILRPNGFMQLFSSGVLGSMISHHGVLRAPAAAAQASYIDVRDVAGAAAAALLHGKYAAPGYTLTGGAALDAHEVLRCISNTCGRELRYLAVDDEEARQLFVSTGLPVLRVERLMEFFELLRRGFCAPVKPSITELLGRPPIGFQRYANDHALAWRLSF